MRNPRPDSFNEAYGPTTVTGRYSVWLLAITHQSDNINFLELIELISNSVFADYKIYKTDYYNKDKSKIIGENIYIIGQTRTRKRVSTLKNDITSVSDILEMEVRSKFKILTFKFLRSYNSFNNNIMKAQLVSSKTKASEYSGRDIRKLDLREKRYPWQNSMIDIFYDEKSEKFKQADDRSIYWITDEYGNVGKSKLVKWLCINRPDEVTKVVFGSAQQLRTSLITVGSRKVYIIDIPRTPSEDEKFENMVLSIEEVKNGHIVSHMYGKFSQLVMDPPHIIILSNQNCPKHLLSQDRWKAFYISKDFKLVPFVDKNYKMG